MVCLCPSRVSLAKLDTSRVALGWAFSIPPQRTQQFAAMERAPGGALDTTMRLLMRKTPVYISFIFIGAIVGERVVDYGFNKIWDRNNVGKRFEDIPKLGTRIEAEES